MCVCRESEVQVHLIINEKNIGYIRNFEQAILSCTGDIIFLCDQDDIWEPNKVEIIVQYFSRHPDKKICFTNGCLIDAKGVFLNKTLFDTFGFRKRQQLLFEKGLALELFIESNIATGATMALLTSAIFHFSSFADTSKPFIHDEILCANALDPCHIGYITQSLIRYRIHKGQNLGVDNKLSYHYRRYPYKTYRRSFLYEALPNLKSSKRLHFYTQRRDTSIVECFTLWKEYRFFYGKLSFIFFFSDIAQKTSSFIRRLFS